MVGPHLGGAGEPTTDLAPRSEDGRQHGDRPEDLLAVLAVLGSDQDTYSGRRLGRHAVREPLDPIRVDAALDSGPLRCPLSCALAQVVPADGVLGDPRGIDVPVPVEHMHEPEDERDVTPGAHLEERVGLLGRVGAHRIDDDDMRAVDTCLLDHRPEVAVGDAGVGAPQDDRARVPQ